MSDLSHPQSSLSHIFLLPNRKHTLLMGTVKGKVTPETTELFWRDEAGSVMQSRSSIVIFFFFFFLFFSFFLVCWLGVFLAPQIFSAIKMHLLSTQLQSGTGLANPPGARRVPMTAVSPFLVPCCWGHILSQHSTCRDAADWHWLKISPLRLTANFIALVSGGILQSACLGHVYVTEQEKLHKRLYPPPWHNINKFSHLFQLMRKSLSK